MKYSATIALALLWVASSSGQQSSVQSDSTGIDVVVTPRKLPPGSGLRISGTMVSAAQSDQVDITIRLASRVVGSGRALVGRNGAFSTTLNAPAVAGEYSATRVSRKNEKWKGSAPFTVLPLDGIVRDLDKAVTSLSTSTNMLEREAEHQIQNFPESPQKTTLIKQVQDLKPKLADSEDDWKEIPKALDDIRMGVEADPRLLSVFAPLFGSVVDWTATTNATLQAIPKESSAADRPGLHGDSGRFVVARSAYSFSSVAFPVPAQNPSPPRTDTLCQGFEDTKVVSQNLLTIFLLGKKLPLVPEPDFKGNLLIDTSADSPIDPEKAEKLVRDAGVYGLGKFAEALGASPTTVGLVTSGYKILYKVREKGPVETFKQALLEKAISYIPDQIEQHYCDTVTGTFTATMSAEARRTGHPWWRYKINIAGTFSLQIEIGGNPNTVTGKFSGKGVKFWTWENAFLIGEPALAHMVPSLHKVYALYSLEQDGGVNNAPSGGYDGINGGAESEAEPGPIDSALRHADFNIPVFGSFDGTGTIALQMLPAEADFSPFWIKARAKYLGISTVAPVASLVEFNLPYQNASFILARAFGDQSTNPGAGSKFSITLPPFQKSCSSSDTSTGRLPTFTCYSVYGAEKLALPVNTHSQPIPGDLSGFSQCQITIAIAPGKI